MNKPGWYLVTFPGRMGPYPVLLAYTDTGMGNGRELFAFWLHGDGSRASMRASRLEHYQFEPMTSWSENSSS